MSKSNPQSIARIRFISLMVATLLGVFSLLAIYSARSVEAVGSSTIVISQVYGGGGNTGAQYQNDFVELFNRGTSTVSLSGWSVGYASATGTGNFATAPISGSIAPGQYYLVKLGPNSAVGAPLPAPDTNGSTSINMSGTTGKVVVATTTTLACNGGSTPCSAAQLAQIVDLVGYGTGGSGANFFEGAPAPTLSNTTADFRDDLGCTDTDNNSADFSSASAPLSPAAPAPRNTASATHSCSTTNFTLNVTTAGAGAGTVTSSPAGISCPGTCSASYTSGTPVTLTASAGVNSTFTGWSGDCSGTGPCTVTMSAAHNVTATFTSTQRTLNVTPAGTGTGNVTSSPAGINCGPTCSASYTNGTVVTLTAAADVNSTFAGWGGDCSGTGTCTVTMNATHNVTATFTSSQRTLSVSRAGTGTGTVTSSPAGINCGSTCSATYADATVVTLTATPDALSTFAGWSGACTGTGTCNITMDGDKSATATFTFSAPQVKISQVYGGGGNSGATYTNDFIELYNAGSTPVSLNGWSVQETSGTVTSWTTNGAPTLLSGTIQPGHYYLVQESQGANGTAPLPASDASGVIMMGGTNGKVALVASTVALSGNCPLGGFVVDLVGYGNSTCAEGGAPTPALDNTTADVRRGNGCQDTDNNFADFLTVGPIPRNSLSPANGCGGDPTQPSGLGTATPNSLEPASETLLTVSVSPATAPPSTGIAVSADLTSIGGAASQPLYDDGSNGDVTAGDNVFSYRATVSAAATTGAKSMVATVTDAQTRSINVPITLTVISPTCGVERWSVKVGTDPDATLVDLNNPVQTTIAALGAVTPPADPPGPPLNARVAPQETTVYTVYATMTLYKHEDDVDYHIVLQDGTGHTMIAEIPSPACILAQNPSGPGRVLVTSPFTQGITNSRAKFDSRFNATTSFQTANIPVRVTGVGFFDFIHGQSGVAPNGIELHPVLSIDFVANTSTTLMSSVNPSQYGQAGTITTTVTNGGSSTPTGDVTFFDGGNPIGTRTLDANGQASFDISTFSTGSHSITVSYPGDTTSGPSTSAALNQVVNKASSITTVTCPASQVYTGGAIEPCTATVTGAGGLTQSVPVTYTDNVSVGIATANASFGGDDNHEASLGSSTFEITKAPSTTIVTCPASQTYTGSAIEPCTASYSGAGGLSGTLTPTYSSNIDAGSANATATYGGDANHEGSTGNSGFTITKASSSTVVTCPASETYTGSAIEPCSATVTGVGGLNQPVTPVTYTDNTNAGSATAAATYAGDANHDGSSGNGGFTIAKASSTIAVSCPASETYTGSAIEPCTATVTGAGGLNQSVPVTYTNNINAGTATANATFGGDANHENSSGSATFTITKATPTITWANPADIVYGTALGSTQLNATANVPGSFSYTPASGSVLNAGGAQPLLASFTPSDTVNYNATSRNVQINVLKATPSFSNLSSPTIGCHAASTVLSGTIAFGSFIPTGSVAITLNSVTQSAAIQPNGSFSSSFNTSSLTPANSPLAITYSYAGDGNFNPAGGGGTLTIVDTAAPTITLNGNSISFWPPNHSYHTVNVSDLVASASDSCDASVNLNSVVISQVSSDEGTVSSGDIVIAANCKAVQLQADRDGGGDGRVYTITFRVTDVNHNSTTVTAKVTVPHDNGHPNAIDSGAAYTITGSCP